MFGNFRSHLAPHWRSHTARLAVLATTVALGGVVMAVAATPSSAATCNGYVGLTFDDGPTGSTSALLNVLRNNGVRATMFNVGQNVQNNRSTAQAQVAAGMWVANHSWNHSHMTSFSQSQMQSDLSQTNQAIQSATGSAPRLFRPPFGETNSTLQSVASSLGMRQIIWDVDSQDWNGASVSAIVAANGRLQAGQIILMHDGIQNTRDAIPQIMANLTSRNLCPGMISPSTGRAVAPDGTTPRTGGPTTPPPSSPPPGGGVVGLPPPGVVGGGVLGGVVPSGATARPVDGEIMPGHRLRLVRLAMICGMASRVFWIPSCIRMTWPAWSRPALETI